MKYTSGSRGAAERPEQGHDGGSGGWRDRDVRDDERHRLFEFLEAEGHPAVARLLLSARAMFAVDAEDER